MKKLIYLGERKVRNNASGSSCSCGFAMAIIFVASYGLLKWMMMVGMAFLTFCKMSNS